MWFESCTEFSGQTSNPSTWNQKGNYHNYFYIILPFATMHLFSQGVWRKISLQICAVLILSKKPHPITFNKLKYIWVVVCNLIGSFCGQCRSWSDCTECAVWSLIYSVHLFHSRLKLNCLFILQMRCISNQWKNMIYLFGSERVKVDRTRGVMTFWYYLSSKPKVVGT